MHDEHLEHELVLLKFKQVSLVCPSFGTVSYSYTGVILWNEIGHKIQFHLHANDFAIIFYVEDVEKLDVPHSLCDSYVIRLKGPHDYRQEFQTEIH